MSTVSINQILKSNNVNVVKTLKNNVNVNNVYPRNEKDFIADKLVTELNNPEARPYYCKVAWRLSEAQIWSALEQAKGGKDPRKYFTWLTKMQMELTHA